MSLLSFTAARVAAQIAHARGCSIFLPNWNGQVCRPALILIVGTYDVPSGLGGRFRVVLKDATDPHAIVRNHGNCEDFDEMLPYRMPLDALIEIDDRRMALRPFSQSHCQYPAAPRALDGVDAPSRHRCAKVAVSKFATRRKRPWRRLAL